MNFDDIKKAMEDEPNDLPVPLSVKDIKSSHSLMKKIKNRLIIEILISLLLIVVLMINPSWNKMHETAQSLYYLTVFNVVMVILGFILFQLKTINDFKVYDLTSRQSIEMFIIKIKSVIEVGKYFSFGIFAALCLPVFIIYVGSVHVPESHIQKYLHLNIPWWQMALFIAGVILIAFLGSVYNWKILQKMYSKQLQNLEKIIKQF